MLGAGLVLALSMGELALSALNSHLPELATFPTPESQLKYHDLAVEGRDVDAVVLGSSSLEAAFDPGQVSSSITAYNLAMPFTDLATMYLWLSEVVFEHARPNIVVIGLSLWEKANAISVSEATARALNGSNQNAYLNVLVRHGSLASLDQSIARERLLAASLWTPEGHQTAYYREPSLVEEWPVLRSAVLTNEEIASLQSLIALIRANHAEPVMIVEPVATARIDDLDKANRYLDMLRDVAGRFGVGLWELPVAFGDSEFYVDGLHLTREGTSRFSLHLADRLQSITVSSR